MSAELNVGVLGAGWFGREAHLANLVRLDGVNVIAASSRSQSSLDKAKALVGEHLHTFTDWQKVIEIDSIDALRGRFVPLTETSFTCTLVNKARDRSVAHITVHCRGSSHGFSDIFYSFSENAADNTANGGFSIKADEYELYLAPMMFGSGRDDERLTAEGAAETLWAEFLQHAGVTYD